MFSITLSNRALKSIRNADSKIRNRVHELLDVLSREAVLTSSYDVLKLSGSDGFYRIRLSGHRVQYFVDFDRKKIQILAFERRDENTYR